MNPDDDTGEPRGPLLATLTGISSAVLRHASSQFAPLLHPGERFGLVVVPQDINDDPAELREPLVLIAAVDMAARYKDCVRVIGGIDTSPPAPPASSLN